MHVVASTRAVRIVLVLLLSFGIVSVVYELSPLLDQDTYISRALQSDEYRTVEKQLLGSTAQGQKKTAFVSYPTSELTTVSVVLVAFGTEKAPEITGVESKMKLRLDRLILWVGAGFVVVSIFATLLPTLTRLRFGPLDFEMPLGSAAENAERATSPQAMNLANATPIDLFAQEVAAASGRADGLFVRSTLLLAGGIVMAFIGVSIFYVTLPETQKDEVLMAYLPKVVRPTGVLIFVEAIAWFLLRQYRALVEDYKWFYRLYLKRANYLAALRILQKDPVRPEDAFVAISLVHEDMSGRLKQGETTESLEALKVPEDGPVTEILKTLATFQANVKKEPKVEKSGT